VPKILFPHDTVFISGKTLINDADGTIGVYSGDEDSAIINVATITIAPVGAGESVNLGIAQTNAELPTTVDAAVHLWGRNPNINDYATVQIDETMQGRRVEWYITNIQDGDITWGNPVPINTGDYQQQSAAEDSGKVLVGGQAGGTFGTSIHIDTEIGENSAGIPSTQAVGQLFAGVFLAAHPVGSIYMTVDPANPGDTYGGEWVAWGAGRVPVGVDVSQTEFNSVEKTNPAGTKTHTLTIPEMPSHTHIQNQHRHGITTSGNDDNGSYNDIGSENKRTNYTQYTTPTNQNTGGGQAHNNLQPYITCYMWKRVE
jgi:hypothetical protein